MIRRRALLVVMRHKIGVISMYIDNLRLLTIDFLYLSIHCSTVEIIHINMNERD